MNRSCMMGNIYLHFFLAEKYNWVFASDGYSSESTGLNSFKGVLHLKESSLWRKDSNKVFVACATFAHDI